MNISKKAQKRKTTRANTRKKTVAQKKSIQAEAKPMLYIFDFNAFIKTDNSLIVKAEDPMCGHEFEQFIDCTDSTLLKQLIEAYDEYSSIMCAQLAFMEHELFHRSECEVI